MHLLDTSLGISSGDAQQGTHHIELSPGDIVILAAQDSLLSTLAHSLEHLPPDFPTVRMANWQNLATTESVADYLAKVAGQAQLVIVSLLGGASYWQHGVTQLKIWATQRTPLPALALLPGDDQMEPQLLKDSTVEKDDWQRLWRYLREGGADNSHQLFQFIANRYFGNPSEWQEPEQRPTCLVAYPANAPPQTVTEFDIKQINTHQPCVALLCYRSRLAPLQTEPLHQLSNDLTKLGIQVVLIAITSLKDDQCLQPLKRFLRLIKPNAVVTTTGFSAGAGVLGVDVPVFQGVLAAQSEHAWQHNPQGLLPRDIAMHVAMPEMDGHIHGATFAFKSVVGQSQHSGAELVAHRANKERSKHFARQVAAWLKLQQLDNQQKRLAIVMANYPTHEGRVGNGVGLDTANSVLKLLKQCQTEGYHINDIPPDSDSLMARLLKSWSGGDANFTPTRGEQYLPLAAYENYFATLPDEAKESILQRWGEPEQDITLKQQGFPIGGIQLGNVFIGIQPSRGYHLDIKACYHDLKLPPTHGYLAFYLWLRKHFNADALIHMGKHGTLEWLPGKSLGLSETCYPQLIAADIPHLYPFIVNDPGEGSQAKRRTSAVILDHMTPPLTRAETYGTLCDLEHMLDEYASAQELDPQRAHHLRHNIIDLMHQEKLDSELTERNEKASDEDEKLRELDAYLCDLKEAQIRDGLHIFGMPLSGPRRTSTLMALCRLPVAEQKRDGLLHTLAKDLGWQDFDPLQCDLATHWHGDRPELLNRLLESPWRTCGDTRERLELLAEQLISHYLPAQETTPSSPPPYNIEHLPLTANLLDFLAQHVAPQLDACGKMELHHCFHALNGQHVPPGPSGAPSRGRLDVLPTGRNFYSLDPRGIPTHTAWQLGQKAAAKLLEKHYQSHNRWPLGIGLTVWGTSTMRTGGDDIAMAFALLGVRPVWDTATARVVNFEVIPLAELGRPRVDVTLRISGFFRDAFAGVIGLFHAAVQTVAKCPEPKAMNPLAANYARDRQQAVTQGTDTEIASQQAGWRVFGPRPGSYGAGLKNLIDGKFWDTPEDLAEAWLNWGGHAYDGSNLSGNKARDVFATRIGNIDAVVQNQDNREHDILDSDDYYQFQGGMANAVRVLRGHLPPTYHADNSNPAAPRIRSLKEELQRVFRARVINPKWLKGVQRHGYRGAAEMAATVDYLFAYDATTGLVDSYQYQKLTETWLFDEANYDFLKRHNPHALHGIAERLLEAHQRRLWQQADEGTIAALEDLLLDTEALLEEGALPGNG